ncbi:PIR Superfamily Protein [Plasmodium ovale wallikeri]|uniref:PIR Superfamily Protein n=1 Tax=Plasmodium ovale wallikeri TaxID=864142 RepID=A0A1A9AS26_PLAOA|nr:PIR Superfamily Protein [Plasmodium ovale wallikeri]SBT58927.1 PIR Superfamily Protein [Plasmodium ovale wallikeri]
MAALQDNEWEDILKELPTYQIYNEFDSDVQSIDKGDCLSLETEKEEVSIFCKKLVRNLRKLPDIEKYEDRKERCFYLQHWAYYKIRKVFSKYSNNINKGSILSKLRGIATTINYKDLSRMPCGCPFAGNEKEWKDEKDLHDFFKNHNSIKCNDFDINKCQKYHDYVTYIKGLYDNFNNDDECCYYGLLDESCTHYFNCEKDYDPSDLLTKLNEQIGALKKKSDKADETLTSGVALNIPVAEPENSMSLPLENSEQVNGTKGLQESIKCEKFPSNTCPSQISKGLTRASSHITGGDNVDANSYLNDGVLPMGDELISVMPLSTDIQAKEDANLSSIVQSETYILESPSFRKGLTVASIIGTVLFFSLYFRSRSCQFCSNKKVKRKKKYRNYLYDMNGDELSTDEFESVYIYTPSNRLYMAYHPDRNSEQIQQAVYCDLEQ